MEYRLALALLASIGCGSAPPPAPAQPPAASSCASAPAVIHVASIPPRTGETLHYEESATYDVATGDTVYEGSTRYITDETVESVDDKMVESLAVNFVEGNFQPDNRKPAVVLTGKQYRARLGGEDTAFFEGDARAAEDVETALEAYAREDVGRPHYLLQLLTDATYKQGERVHLTGDSYRGSKGRPADARVTLRKLDGDRATFDVEIRHTAASGAPIFTHGQAVLDTTRARLVSSDLIGELDPDDEQVRMRKLRVTVDFHERYDYGAAPAAASRPSACAPHTTLFMPWNPPRVGETFSFEQALVADWTLTNPKTNAKVRLKGGWEAATDERVLEVTDGVITALEASVRKDVVRPMQVVGPDHGEVPPISKSGDKLEIRMQGDKLVFKRGGVEVDPQTDQSTQILYRADVPLRFWLTRLVTDRTFEVGVESTYPNEVILALARDPSDVRIMLASITEDVAHFQLDIKTKLPVGDRTVIVFMRGKLDFDIKLARPLALSLAGDFDVASGIDKDGQYTLDYKFRY